MPSTPPKKFRNLKKILINLALMAAITIVLVVVFFFAYLPWATNHGKTVTVPDLEGKHVTELENYLDTYNLRHEVEDSAWSADHPPLTVLHQYPKPGANVKSKRKIYVTLNPSRPPEVSMPDLIGKSVKSATMMLKSYGLTMGKITYEPDIAKNSVLKQKVKGEEITSGKQVPKGTAVDLVVSDGYGEVDFPVPQLLGQSLDYARFIIKGQGLQVGAVVYVSGSTYPSGTVVKQSPEAKEESTVRMGEAIDLWVVE